MQAQTTTPSKSPGDLRTAEEQNQENLVINNNSIDAETRLTALEDLVPIERATSPPANTSNLWYDTRVDELFYYKPGLNQWLSVGNEESITFITPQTISPDGYFEVAPGIIEYLVLQKSSPVTITCDKGSLVDGTIAIETDIDGAIGAFSITSSSNLEGGDVVITPPGIISAGAVLKIKLVGVVDISDTYITLTLKKLAQ